MNGKIKVGILYICTGNYDIFWKGFHESSEKFFLDEKFEKHYFVFTDSAKIKNSDRIHTFFQQKLGWPMDTLMRFEMFSRVKDRLADMNYLLFINANMKFCVSVSFEEMFKPEKGLFAVLHPGFYNKDRTEFTYETNPESAAYMAENEGTFYFMGGLNGGTSTAYLTLIEALKNNIATDLQKNIIALWHDESHLNKYLNSGLESVHILSPSYGFKEGDNSLPFECKIIIQDKNKFGGHEKLRKKQSFFKKLFKK